MVALDRREALKKLAAGATVGLTAPLIMQSTAFADSGTATCLPAPFANPNNALAGTINVAAVTLSDTAEHVRIRIPENTAAFTGILCPIGYTKQVRYRWGVVTAPGATDIVPNNDGAPSIADRWRNPNAVRIVTTGSPDTLSNSTSPGNNYVINVQVRVACLSTTRACWRCTSFQVSFDWTYDGTAGLSALGGVGVKAVAGSANCDRQPPDPLP